MAKKFIKLTEDEFYEKFTPTINHLVNDAPFGGTMYETYGAENDFINEFAQSEHRTKIWTIEEVEGNFYFVSGWHYVNRYGYIITEEAVMEVEEYEIKLDNDVDEPNMHTAKFVKEITVIDPDTGDEIELTVYKHQGGGMFAMDSSFLDQCVKTDDFDRLIIPDPFSNNDVEDGILSHLTLLD